MNRAQRTTEAERLRPIYEAAIDSLDEFLNIVTIGYVNKPTIIDRNGHEAVRLTTATPCDAVFLKFARVVSLNRAMFILMVNGFIQEQAIIQRSIEETNEDIMFLVVNITETGASEKFLSHLEEFWKEDYEDPNRPTETHIRRGFTRKGVSSFLNRVFVFSNPSRADSVQKSIFSFYSGFTHGAAPHIMELYDTTTQSFLTRGLLGTDRQLDYLFDAKNSIYRSLLSTGALAKAFGSEALHRKALEIIEAFQEHVGLDQLLNPDDQQ